MTKRARDGGPQLSFWRSSFSLDETGKNLSPTCASTKFIRSHGLNSKIQVCIAGNHMKNIVAFEDELSYESVSLRFEKLLDPQFASNVLQKGNFSALSNTAMDRGNSMTIENGVLRLSLDKDTYEQIGLVGQPSKYKDNRKWNLTLPLKETDKACQLRHRAQQCLSSQRVGNCNLLAIWEDDEGNQLSLKDTDLFDKVVTRPITSHFEVIDHAVTPTIDLEKISERDSSFRRMFWSDVFEWVGFLSTNSLSCLSKDGVISEYASDYTWPHETSRVDWSVWEWAGLMSSVQVLELLRDVRDQLVETKAPFAVLSVWGFDDSLVTFNAREHTFDLSGENNYSFLVFPDDSYCLYTATNDGGKALRHR